MNARWDDVVRLNGLTLGMILGIVAQLIQGCASGSVMATCEPVPQGGYALTALESTGTCGSVVDHQVYVEGGDREVRKFDAGGPVPGKCTAVYDPTGCGYLFEMRCEYADAQWLDTTLHLFQRDDGSYAGSRVVVTTSCSETTEVTARRL